MRSTIITTCLALIVLASCTKSPYGDDPNPDPEDNWNEVIINEILSFNESVIADEHDDYDDYIEIYNPQDTSIDLSGYFLSDDPLELFYEFPLYTVLQPDTVIIIWCDGEPEEGDYHAGFRVNSDGEWVGLYDFYGSLIDSVTVPALPADSAYARDDSTSEWCITSPSPGTH